jgi:glycosyltransferase involved in cell wall biosynthesis
MNVSVIIPSFKPGLYLFDCLNSIINQDFNTDNFELVIVLNGQKDPYFELIHGFLENKKTNFRLLYTPVKGVSSARNFALDNIKSEYIVFLDDDDLLSENFLSSLYSGVSSDTIVASNLKTFFPDLKNLKDNYVSRAFNKCKNGRKYSLFNYSTFLSNACGKMIPMSIINGFRFDENLALHEDAIFMFKISRNIRLIRLADKNAVYYNRLRKGSASRRDITPSNQIRNLLRCLYAYTFIYFSNWPRYNFLLYVSRIGGTFKFYLYKFFNLQ